MAVQDPDTSCHLSYMSELDRINKTPLFLLFTLGFEHSIVFSPRSSYPICVFSSLLPILFMIFRPRAGIPPIFFVFDSFSQRLMDYAELMPSCLFFFPESFTF